MIFHTRNSEFRKCTINFDDFQNERILQSKIICDEFAFTKHPTQNVPKIFASAGHFPPPYTPAAARVVSCETVRR